MTLHVTKAKAGSCPNCGVSYEGLLSEQEAKPDNTSVSVCLNCSALLQVHVEGEGVYSFTMMAAEAFLELPLWARVKLKEAQRAVIDAKKELQRREEDERGLEAGDEDGLRRVPGRET